MGGAKKVVSNVEVSRAGKGGFVPAKPPLTHSGGKGEVETGAMATVLAKEKRRGSAPLKAGQNIGVSKRPHKRVFYGIGVHTPAS